MCCVVFRVATNLMGVGDSSAGDLGRVATGVGD